MTYTADSHQGAFQRICLSHVFHLYLQCRAEIYEKCNSRLFSLCKNLLVFY